VEIYGISGLNNTKSTFRNQTLSSPSLNITAYEAAEIWNGFVNPNGMFAYTNIKFQTVYYYGTTQEYFDTEKLQANGSCQPTSTYKWGFSFMILFICLLLVLLWSIGTYIMWLKAHLALRAHGEPEIVGEYKAVIELAAAMNNEFGKHNENTEFLREQQIQGKIRHVMNGGTMWYDSPLQGKEFTFWDGFKRWVKKDKWWWPAYISSAAFLVLGSCKTDLFFISLFLFMGVFTARTVGQTWKSRCLIVLIFTTFGIIVEIALMGRH
jgi:hypothetical protein